MEEKRSILTPDQDALDHIVDLRDKPFLEERYIDSIKGRGVFTDKAIKQSSFVVEYRGNIFPYQGARPKRKRHDTLTNYFFEFSWNGEHWCIDASTNDGTLGRLVNDDHINPNCEIRKIVCDDTPHLCLFAVKEISPGEEITYNYGESNYSWRSKFEESDTASSSENSGSDDNASYTNKKEKAVPSSDDSDSDKMHRIPKTQTKTKSNFYTSKNYCYVCGAGFSKISRHLLRHIHEEPDIAEAFALRKKSKGRKKLLENLRNRGNYKHNQEVLKCNRGKLKLKRRPTTVEGSSKDLLHCLYCKCMFKHKDIFRHTARCPFRMQFSEINLMPELPYSSFTQELPPGVWNIFLTMKKDKISSAVQNDVLVIQLAQNLSEKHENNPSKIEHIRQTLRDMGRLLIALHKKAIFSFEDAIKPRNFNKVLEVVKNICGFDEKMQDYGKPSLAFKLSHMLKKMGTIVLADCDGSERTMRDTKKFLQLCTNEWSELVSQKLGASLSGQKVLSASTIPFTRDVQVFHSHLETTSALSIESLKMHEKTEAYSALCRVTLTQVSILNKCGPEVSKMTLRAFQEREDATQVLSKHFIRINILSKTGQNVAVLLTSELVRAMTMLESKRETCGVHRDNLFFFAMPDSSSTSLYNGRDCIKFFSDSCGAKNPEHLRCVQLHKHITRIFQILNLENDELGHLAKLLGQDLRADRDYYQSPEAAMELAKISKLLLEMEKGSLDNFKGNSLEDIEIADELLPEMEQDNHETGNAEKDNESESDVSLKLSDPVEQQAVMEEQSSQQTPEQDALQQINTFKDKPFLEERLIDTIKGKGVFTRESIEPLSFVVEYRGILTKKYGGKKKCEDTLKDYFFDFSWKGKNWRIDASQEDGTLGRLVNDDHIKPNCKMKKIICEGRPHLCLFAVKKISSGEEINFNYGGSSYPWRSEESSEELNASTKGATSSPENEQVKDSQEGSPSEDLDGDSNGEPSDNSPFFRDAKKKIDSSKQQSCLQQPDDDLSIQEEDEAGGSSDYLTSDEETRAVSLTRKNYCYVCGSAKSKISRHLFTHRKKDPEIAEVFALPPSSKERSALLDKLRERGNEKHNQEVSKTGSGDLKVPITAKPLAHCVYCKGKYSRKVIWLHMKKCQSKKPLTPSKRGRSKILAFVAAAESTDSNEVSEDVKQILRTLEEEDSVSEVVNDPHLLLLAQWCRQTNKSKSSKNDSTAQKLKLVGRLLLALKKKSICSFGDAMKPQNFSKLVEAVREIIGFNEEMNSYRNANRLMKLAILLTNIGNINFARALKDNDNKQILQEAETFIAMCEKEWICPRSKVKGIPVLPFIHDVQLLYQCMEKIATSAVESLSMYEVPQVYNALLRVTAAQASILNKKIGDVSKVTLQSYNERSKTEGHEEGHAPVPPTQFEQILSKHFVKINLMSNKGKEVSVTMMPKQLAALTLLVSKRAACGVHKDNPFLFGRSADKCTSFCYGQQFVNIFIDQCGAKNTANLKSVSFRKYVARLFQIFSLSSSGFEELAKMLGHNIRTNRDYYQTPEAAADIAKISELLSAMENGSLQRFKGKSLEEIEIAGELEPDTVYNDVENKKETSLQLADIFGDTVTGVSSSPIQKKNRGIALKKRGRGRKKDCAKEAPELNHEMHTKKDDGSVEIPKNHDAGTPEETLPHSNKDITRMSISDDDEDMNVDFEMDTDKDDVRNEENDGHSDTNHPSLASIPEVQDMDNDSSHTKEDVGSPGKLTISSDHEDTMDTVPVSHVEKDEQEGEQKKVMDVDEGCTSAILSTEKKNTLSAAMTGMREVKIVIKKLDIEKLWTTVHVSQLSSLFKSCKSSLKCQPIQDANNQCATSPAASTDLKKQSSPKKTVEMTCSHCRKTMMKGQTAFQKKGFTDVFCSKACLFALFPINKTVTKMCYYCHKEISQPLDLIMTAVDLKGTVKDFCSVTCLSTFKSSPVSIHPPKTACSMCRKSCTATCELTLNDTLQKFCSASCMEDFCRDNMAVCDHCRSTCFKKPLKLKLEKETKHICSDNCLKEFKKKIKTSHQCSLCHTSGPVSDMVCHKTSEDRVELFCNQLCVSSYKICPKTKGASISAQGDGKIPPTIHTSVSSAICCQCKKEVESGDILYKPKNSKEVFCSPACLSERHPHLEAVIKKCYNCFQIITRPRKIILAPVDDSGTRRELCSDACLSSVNSKRKEVPPKPKPPTGPRTDCIMCKTFGVGKFKLTFDGVMYRLCSDACFINYHKVNNIPIFICDVCRSICSEKHLILKMGDETKTLCTEECLVKLKENIKTPQLCPMCKTSHQMSDMVEDKDEECRLNCFCSNRCILVHKAQSLILPEMKTLAFDDEDIKEVKPPLLKLIKEEPVDEMYNHNLSSSISTVDIKDEPKVYEEDIKICSLFSLTGDSTSSTPSTTQTDLPSSCSHCSDSLMDGETVYQRKGNTDIFCSTSCLLKFHQMKQEKKMCHFCLQEIILPQDVLQASVDNEDMMKDFCSQTCLSSFNYKSMVVTKMPIEPVASHSQCSVCSRYCISKHEIIQHDVIHKICSNPCFHRFCNRNNLCVCENCGSHCSSPVVIKMKNGSKKLCNSECLSQFKQKITTLQPCAMCSTSRLISDMVGNRNSDSVVEFFCTSTCVMAFKIQAVCALGVPFNCDDCGKATVPACHLAMSDNTIRNFCTLTCAMTFKESQNSATNVTLASDSTQGDFLQTPERFSCPQCQHIIKTKPKVIQTKDKIHFVCSLSCSEEFKRVNNIMGKCDYCKTVRIISETKRVDNKASFFCSDGCKVLFCHELEKSWGNHCHSCAYCLSISKTVVTGPYKGTEEKFCSEECNSKYKMLLCHAAQCDACGTPGTLRQTLPMLGEVKRFCGLKCLLHFCNKLAQFGNKVSSPTGSASIVESFPVIANVVSLAGVLAKQSSVPASSVQHDSVSDVLPKVVGHASVQTVPKELKNKSILCTPLVHNKGVSCTIQTTNTETQTDEFVPKALPVPVPVYIPVPMNMYSQYTPQPVGIPIPLPVPVFIPVLPNGSDVTGKSMTERVQQNTSEGELHLKSEMKKRTDDKKETEDRQSDRVMIKDLQRLKIDCPKDVVTHSKPKPEPPPSAPPPASDMRAESPAPTPLSQQTLGKVNSKHKGHKVQKVTSHRESSTASSRKHSKLRSKRGMDVWKRWIQWRESQTNLFLVSSPAVTLNKDVLHCSASELSDSLHHFVTEVRRRDGAPYPPDKLLYLCLSIQLYLIEKGRLEDIFNDLNYQKFNEEFTKILRGFNPSVTTSGYIHTHVEENFLWDCKQLGAYSPFILLNTLIFFCCKYFGYTTGEQHRQLSFAHVVHYTRTNKDHSKTTFLRFYPPVSMAKADADADGIPAKKRRTSEPIVEMMENTQDPLRCPVRLYEFYLSKCSESVRQRTDLFYLLPDRSCVPNSPLWFSTSPLDDNTMNGILVRILTVRELYGAEKKGVDKRTSANTLFTNHEEDSE